MCNRVVDFPSPPQCRRLDAVWHSVGSRRVGGVDQPLEFPGGAQALLCETAAAGGDNYILKITRSGERRHRERRSSTVQKASNDGLQQILLNVGVDSVLSVESFQFDPHLVDGVEDVVAAVFCAGGLCQRH